MAFEEPVELDTDVVFSLGGVDKKTGKKNPTQVEGYFLGSKEIPDKYAKSGKGYLHIFLTPNGNVGVFGKTDLNRKMMTVDPGTMTRVTYTGTLPTKYGPMAKFKREIDKDRTIPVDVRSAPQPDAEAYNQNTSYAEPDAEELSEIDVDDDEVPTDVVELPRATKHTAAAISSSSAAAQKARVEALLSKGKKTA